MVASQIIVMSDIGIGTAKTALLDGGIKRPAG
jgi:hypothetical protein